MAADPISYRICYDRLKLLTSAFSCLVMGFATLSTLFLPLTLWPIALLLLRRAFGDKTAVRWDAHGITMRNLFNTRHFAWENVQSLRLQREYARIYYIIPIWTWKALTLVPVDGFLGRNKTSVAIQYLDVKESDLKQLVAMLQATQAAYRKAVEANPVLGHPDAPRPDLDQPVRAKPAMAKRSPRTSGSFFSWRKRDPLEGAP